MNQLKERINKAIRFYRTFIVDRKKFDSAMLEKTLPVFLDLVEKYVNADVTSEATPEFAEGLFK